MDFLKVLGIQSQNSGASTGCDWFATTDQGELKVTSPVDGKAIASVTMASSADYEKIVTTG
jgi:aldehyde dehydrogenase (NAD+)